MFEVPDGRRPAEADTELGALQDFAAAVYRWRVALATRHGLTVTDTVVLSALLAAVDASADGSSDPAALVTAAALARAVEVPSGRITGALDRLEAAGLARRVPNPTDRRSVLVAPTAAGRRADAALPDALRAVAGESLDAGFRERFVARLRSLADAVDRARAPLDRRR